MRIRRSILSILLIAALLVLSVPVMGYAYTSDDLLVHVHDIEFCCGGYGFASVTMGSARDMIHLSCINFDAYDIMFSVILDDFVPHFCAEHPIWTWFCDACWVS